MKICAFPPTIIYRGSRFPLTHLDNSFVPSADSPISRSLFSLPFWIFNKTLPTLLLTGLENSSYLQAGRMHMLGGLRRVTVIGPAEETVKDGNLLSAPSVCSVFHMATRPKRGKGRGKPREKGSPASSPHRNGKSATQPLRGDEMLTLFLFPRDKGIKEG